MEKRAGCSQRLQRTVRGLSGPTVSKKHESSLHDRKYLEILRLDARRAVRRAVVI